MGRGLGEGRGEKVEGRRSKRRTTDDNLKGGDRKVAD